MKPMDEFPLLEPSEGVPLFYPHVSKIASANIAGTLSTRWIGQGPKVDLFEKNIKEQLSLHGYSLAVSSGTAALHLAYVLSGVTKGTDVLCPVFTCTATNLPILYQGGNPIFLDIASGSLNINTEELEKKVTKNTVALTVVDYGGVPNDYKLLRNFCDKHKLKLIADCAHAIDGTVDGRHVSAFADYTIFSFQAIKTLTTGDGGMLIVKDHNKFEEAKRLRWFGIDRAEKQKGIWENDVHEIGFKYQMNDISASMGLAGLTDLDHIFAQRKKLFLSYKYHLEELSDLIFEKYENELNFTPWLITINTEGRRVSLMKHLRDHRIESAQVHYRNDRYSVFRQYVNSKFPNMDLVEDDYLVLPLHTRMSEENVIEICDAIKIFWNGK